MDVIDYAKKQSRFNERERKLRMAVVTGLLVDMGRVTVKIGGDDTAVQARYLGSYDPQLNDTVLVYVEGADVLVLGTTQRATTGDSRDFIANPITNDELADDAVGVNNIIDGAVARVKIAEAAINAALIDAGAVTETKIANDAISTPKLQSNSIIGDHIQARQVDAFHIVAGAITANEILTGTLTSASGVFGDISANDITTGTLNVDRIASGSIGTVKLASNLQSDNFVSGVSGWFIDRATGSVEFDDGVFRGDIEGATVSLVDTINNDTGDIYREQPYIGTIGQTPTGYTFEYYVDGVLTSGSGWNTVDEFFDLYNPAGVGAEVNSAAYIGTREWRLVRTDLTGRRNVDLTTQFFGAHGKFFSGSDNGFFLRRTATSEYQVYLNHDSIGNNFTIWLKIDRVVNGVRTTVAENSIPSNGFELELRNAVISVQLRDNYIIVEANAGKPLKAEFFDDDPWAGGGEYGLLVRDVDSEGIEVAVIEQLTIREPNPGQLRMNSLGDLWLGSPDISDSSLHITRWGDVFLQSPGRTGAYQQMDPRVRLSSTRIHFEDDYASALYSSTRIIAQKEFRIDSDKSMVIHAGDSGSYNTAYLTLQGNNGIFLYGDILNLFRAKDWFLAQKPVGPQITLFSGINSSCYLSFHRQSISRTGYIGNGSASNDDLYVHADGNTLRLYGSSIDAFAGVNVINNVWGSANTSTGISLNINGSGWFARNNIGLYVQRQSDGSIQRFYNSATISGTISVSGATTTYGTTSDYRLKENLASIEKPLDTINKLQPITFNWKNNQNSTRMQGFLAHEVQEVIPQAVNGRKDAIQEDGSIEPQSVDHSHLVPLLTAAIQELHNRVVTLEEKGA